MFGTLRFVLACLVAFSHLGGTVFGANPGVFAVIVFFMISGFVVQQILATGCRAEHFMIERAIRIVPAYFAVLISTVLMIPWLDRQSIFFLTKSPGVSDWIANLTIVPLNYFMWNGQDRFTIIPPAWSLALELQFYALAPFVLSARRIWRIAMFAVSLGVWISANLLFINPDWWGYRLLPGTMFIFLCGAELARGAHLGGNMILGGSVFTASILLVAYADGLVAIRPFNLETAAGLAVGLLAIRILRGVPRRRWDDLLGGLAYPIFLTHFVLIWIFAANGTSPEKIVTNLTLFTVWSLATLATSLIIYYAIDVPLGPLRRSLRVQQGKEISKKGIQ
ncbi:COG1835 Predicted acyltransferases [Rhabdaerophilaceae bacterium]